MPDGSGKIDNCQLNIGVVEKNKGEYWDNINKGFEDAGRRMIMSFDIVAPDFEDISEQIRLMERQIDAKPDGIALVASDPTAFNRVVCDAVEEGIPVVTFDLDAPESGRCLYVGTQAPFDLGHQAGQLMVEQSQNVGRVAIQTGSTTAQGAIGKLAGFREVVEEHGFEIVTEINDGEQLPVAYANARACLEEWPDLVGIYGVYGYHPFSQARAMEDVYDGHDLVIIGFDMLPETVTYIKRGMIRASIWIQEYYFGYYAAVALHNIVRIGIENALGLMKMDTKDYKENKFHLPTKVWNQDNIHLFDDQNPLNR